MNRTMMTTIMCVSVLGVCTAGVASAQPMKQWHLGTQAYSFNRFTFYEAVAKTKGLGLNYIEAYPGQRLSADTGNAAFSHDMSAELRLQVKQLLKDSGIRLVNYGVVSLPNNEAECRKVFDFAKDMGIETIVSEPPEDALGLIDKLCQEYQIGVALHNHPKGRSFYWSPDTVLRVCEGRSKWIGACADTGHWTRSGIDPLEAIKKLGAAGRIRSLHFKDLHEFGNDSTAHDVIWGTGVSKAREVLAELARQGFEGSFSIEYEYHWDNSVPEIAGCVVFFKKTAAELSDVPYVGIFKKNLSNGVMESKAWVFDSDGVLSPVGHGDIWTKERYGDFTLELDYKVPEGGNSGVFIRTGSIENWINTAIEIQVHATTDGTPHGQCGAVYDCLSPSKAAGKNPGEWNHYVITCLDNKIYVNLNGADIIDMDLDQWTEPRKNPDGTPNKFPTAYKDMPRVGHLGFQYHGNPVWFKDLKIKSYD